MAIYGYPQNPIDIDISVNSGEPYVVWTTPTANLTNARILSPGSGIAIQISGSNATIIATGSSGQVPGTVYDFTSGNLSPVFTTAVASSTTTPDLSFTLVNQACGRVFIGPQTGANAAPTFRLLTGDDLQGAIQAGSNITITNLGSALLITSTASGGGGGSGTVTSVGLALPSIFSVTGSPVTTSGTLTGSLVNQTSSTFFAGPSAGVAATPTFRIITGNDLSGILVNGTNTTVTNNGATIQVNGNAGTVTTFSAGDLDPLFSTTETNPTTTPALSFTLNNQSANLGFFGPSSGAAGAPWFRGITGNDLVNALQAGTNVSITNNGSTITISATASGGGGGTVSSFSAGNLSPLFSSNVSSPTTTPSLTFTLTSQSSAKFFAGPSSGTDAGPTFRSILGSDVYAALEAGSNISLVNMGSTVRITATDQYQGTVTSVAVGNLSPLWTANTANSTTTPNTTFTQVNAPSASFLRGPSSGADGAYWFGRITGNDLAGVITPGSNTTVTNSGATFSINGNAGTVTSFSAGDLSPLFTTTETDPTTTPALSFSAINQSPNLVFVGPPSGSSTAPGFRGLIGNDLAFAFVNGTNTTVVNNGNTIQVNASDQFTGTVTNVSAGNLVPIFTTNTTNQTTTPVTSFTLSQVASGRFLGGPSSGAAGDPWYRPIQGSDIYNALSAGSNITLTNNGETVQIAAAGGGGGGNSQWGYSSITGTATATYGYCHFVSLATANITLYMPSPASNAGQTLRVKIIANASPTPNTLTLQSYSGGFDTSQTAQIASQILDDGWEFVSNGTTLYQF